ARSIPAAFEATVTYYIKGSSGLFVQDGDLAIYIEASENLTLVPGDRILVGGKAGGGFPPDLIADSVTVVSHRAVPTPMPAGYTQLVRSDLDCVRVKVRGNVRSADLVTYGNGPNIY